MGVIIGHSPQFSSGSCSIQPYFLVSQSSCVADAVTKDSGKRAFFAVTGSKKGTDYLGENYGCREAVNVCSVCAAEDRIVRFPQI